MEFSFFEDFTRNFTAFIAEGGASSLSQYTKWILPVLAVIIFARLALGLWRDGGVPRVLARLSMTNGAKLDVTRCENSIGRGGSADIVVDLPTVSRSHAVLSKRRGRWYVSDLSSKSGVQVNGEAVEGGRELDYGDKISLADVSMTLLPPPEDEPEEPLFTSPGGNTTLFFISLFQIVSFITALFSGDEPNPFVIPVLTGFVAVEWIYYFISRMRGKLSISLELAAFWLSGIGLCMVASVKPDALLKQSLTCGAGIVIFCVLAWFVSDLERARRFRYPMGIAALMLFAANIGLGHSRYGSRNWIQVGDITVQPSEFIKIAYIYAEAAPLDRLLTTKNLTLSILFSGACVGALFFMGDFGTALIFFVTFLVLAFIRSGDFRTIALISSVAAIGAYVIIALRPYIANRFATWRHVWDFADAQGYQQTRTLMYSASGGLTGTGIGEGHLKYISAADTDLVFGLVCEEWGLICAVLAALTIALFVVNAVRRSGTAISSFYVLTAVSASALMVFQLSLNIFGATDVLPLTGVTFPFVSNGGSSIMASWGMLALIKAAQNQA